MGKPTGFLEYARKDKRSEAPEDRIKHFREFYTPLEKKEQEEQGARCMACGVPFCQSGQIMMGMVSGCPLHNLIPEWNDLIYRGNWKEAYMRLKKTNCFPEFTARVCPAPCEAACTCSLNGDGVSIKGDEYAITENAYEEGYAKARGINVRTGKKIAIVGSGPAGLAAADMLNIRGHQVTVFEREDKVGGLLRYGIPNMKLEKKIIDRKLQIMEAEGVTFVTGVDVGRDKKAATLLKEYDRVILACGAANPRDLKVSGRDGKGIYFAVDFLKSTTKALLEDGENLRSGQFVSAKGKHVLVIGGGDTGNDCVGTSIRHGAKSVMQLEMMPEPPKTRGEDNTWPEWPKVLKTDYGQEEAIATSGSDPRRYQTTVKEFIKDSKGQVKEAILVKLQAEKEPKSGRVMMSEVAGSEYTVPADLVLIAAGFLGSEEYVTKAFKVTTDERTNVKTAPESYATSSQQVFAAGDMRRGQSLVVWAIREGQEVAKEVDESLMGFTNLVIQ